MDWSGQAAWCQVWQSDRGRVGIIRCRGVLGRLHGCLQTGTNCTMGQGLPQHQYTLFRWLHGHRHSRWPCEDKGLEHSWPANWQFLYWEWNYHQVLWIDSGCLPVNFGCNFNDMVRLTGIFPKWMVTQNSQREYPNWNWINLYFAILEQFHTPRQLLSENVHQLLLFLFSFSFFFLSFKW